MKSSHWIIFIGLLLISNGCVSSPYPTITNLSPADLEPYVLVDENNKNDKNERHYTVKKGDTLQSIAFQYYHDKNEWKRIYKANQCIIRHPNHIYPGMILIIP